MKYNKIKKNCKICSNEFLVIKSRENTAHFCSRKCYHDSTKGKLAWNSGKKYEEIYSPEKLKEIKKKQSLNKEKNPMFGKKHTKETKQKMRNAKVGLDPWNKGKDIGDFMKDRHGKNNPYIRGMMKQFNLTWDEYNDWTDNKKKYYQMVRRITEQQPLTEIKGYDRRGLDYHLDHIYPIVEGFKNKISPEKIGNIDNLQIISSEDNLRKSDRL